VTRSRYALAIAATLLLALGTFLAARAVSTVGAGGRPPALSASPAAAASTTL
jgi:hypothetical protein